ncbi:trypsin-like peptidase domain-containing protein [Streptomyces sp. NPDC005963]|uniref:trypsin-like serine peptidase n=1 Tax=Streptomyces sp. NPDC005963 TaxID=3156721 RepID=UPI0033D45A18
MSFAPEEPPKFTIVEIDSSSTEASLSMAAATPSRPSKDTEIRFAPQPLPDAQPARVVFAGQEADPLRVFNPDGRKTYNDRTFPWRCACRVSSGPRNVGSGVLIGGRHVLTASHVIDWNALTASVTLNQGGVIGSAAATHLIAFDKVVNVTYTNADDDYAILVLNSRLGDGLGMLGCRTYDAAWDDEISSWWNIAYTSQFFPPSANFQTGFFLDEDELDLGGGRLLETNTGDFVKGMSGSPVFGFWSDGPYVVGVVSAETSDYNWVAGGSNLTRLVNHARATLP